MKKLLISMIVAGAWLLTGANAWADQVIAENVIIQGNVCLGKGGCVDGEMFGFDTLKLKEANIRIKADDTNTSLDPFPFNDWQITFNENVSGGQSFFAIDDLTGGTTPFKIVAGAPDSSLYVDEIGRVGLGTSRERDTAAPMSTKTVEAYKMPVAERVFPYFREPAVIQANKSGKARPTAMRVPRWKSPQGPIRGTSEAENASA